MQDEWKRRVARRIAVAFGGFAVALLALLVWSYHERATERVDIAVLPFHGDSGSARVAQTVTTLVAHRLARLPRFTVLPMSATAGYDASRDSAAGIGRALGVRYLVVGEVNRSPTPSIPDRITIDARLIDTRDSPPAMGQIITTVSTDLCPAVGLIAIDIAGHFARAPRGALWGPRGTTGCAPPKLLEQQLDPGA